MEWPSRMVLGKKSMRYYTLNLPIDLDALTFQISKYGTKNIDIGWTLSTNCQKDNKIEYKNETELILNYIWTNVIGNQTDSYICHRNFENDIDYLELIWKITSIWVGYDFDCYEVNSLKEGILESELISKNDLTKVLAFAVCFLGFMHPFIWYIFESIQVRKECDIFTYYKDVIDSEKPYGLVRCMRKCLYPGKGKTETENTEATDDQTTESTSDKTENTLLNTSIQAEDDPSVSNTAITSDITENTLLKTPNLARDDPAASNTAPTNDTTTLIEETNNDKSSDMTNEILSLDDTINKFEASSTCYTCCKRNENIVNDPVIPNNADTGDSNQHQNYGALKNSNPT
ncbi:unnamed protein product [Mytilus edulis]|uniref:Uncharacterized protein n=1 Tax=Mytilus edulis TaxID=6550 RepID=A0A8S3RRR9_MYTED|nr:unnamed protein product [Mytilus edulis]